MIHWSMFGKDFKFVVVIRRVFSLFSKSSLFRFLRGCGDDGWGGDEVVIATIADKILPDRRGDGGRR